MPGAFTCSTQPTTSGAQAFRPDSSRDPIEPHAFAEMRRGKSAVGRASLQTRGEIPELPARSELYGHSGHRHPAGSGIVFGALALR